MTKISYTESKSHERNYVVAWNPLITEPPFPGMHLDIGLCRWIPDDIEDFATKHGAEFDEVVSKYKNDTGTHKSKSSKKGKSKGSSVLSERRCTTAPSKPAQQKVSKAATATTHQPSALDNPISKKTDEIPAPTSQREVSIAKFQPIHQPNSSEHHIVEQSKKSRVSAKKVDADFDELSHTFLRIVSLGEKKPVFLPLELRNALETLARLSGVPNLAPSHIVINILKAFFDDNRELINRKLSGVKLSI